eukprot:CAMPEP_0171470260 /NCGR_PEP_ID=MMETSP0946-20130122/62_1 /TAXON_ID=109269 /ORGANISM="Vaucheria litorea, Strain CCMP2940" /LENGTH=227 /DNA_ID=CAMNT_0011999643 /DNA_START=199 /DNA_END=882 /DNA_ORIENTATION=-
MEERLNASEELSSEVKIERKEIKQEQVKEEKSTTVNADLRERFNENTKQREMNQTSNESKPNVIKEAADFGLSGALSKDTKTGNIYKGIVLKWSEPEDSRTPTKRWRLYVFKNSEICQTMHIHRQSAYLIGRERKIADIPVDHPSCSKQHAVLQYRLKETNKEEEMVTIREVRPYIMDLASTNGTQLNSELIEASRYYELVEGDCLKFGHSSREYVLLHEKSTEDKI